MNSTVGPIFNEKVAEKLYLWVPCIVHEQQSLSPATADKKKKKKKMQNKTQT